jgi:hypothetical protein
MTPPLCSTSWSRWALVQTSSFRSCLEPGLGEGDLTNCQFHSSRREKMDHQQRAFCVAALVKACGLRAPLAAPVPNSAYLSVSVCLFSGHLPGWSSAYRGPTALAMRKFVRRTIIMSGAASPEYPVGSEVMRVQRWKVDLKRDSV